MCYTYNPFDQLLNNQDNQGFKSFVSLFTYRNSKRLKAYNITDRER